MANELYNFGGGQVTPVSRQRSVLPIGAATRLRQGATGRDVSGTTPMQGQGQGQKQGGFVNILDFMKGILTLPFGLLGGLSGGGEKRFGLRRGQMSPEERLAARQG